MHTIRQYFGMLLLFMLLPQESLFSKVSTSDEYMDKIVGDLQHNVTMLYQTVNYQQRKIEDLEKKYTDSRTENTELLRNFTELQNTIKTREDKLVANLTTAYQSLTAELEGRMNQSFSAYQILLHDAVDKLAPLQNNSLALNKGFSDLTKQFHYVSLSVLDVEKSLTNQQKEIVELSQNVSAQQDFNHHVAALEGRLNESLSAYQVILHDLVDRYNQQAVLYDNRTHDLNKSMTDLGKTVPLPLTLCCLCSGG